MSQRAEQQKAFVNTYNADEVLVTHLFDRNVVDKARDDRSRASLLAEINLL